MSYSKDEGHSYLDFDDNINKFHQIGNKLVHRSIYIYIYTYTSCSTMKFFYVKSRDIKCDRVYYEFPLSKGQFSEFRSEQMLITKSFYFLYSHFQQSYYSYMYMVLNAVNTLVNWSNKSFTIIRFNRYTKHTYT